MTRHVLAVTVALCLSTSTVSAQATAPQVAQLTVKTTAAEVHKFPTVASAVLGKAQVGTVLEVTRNLGSWVEVPWPAGDGGVAFVHVNAGTIANGIAPVSSAAGANAAPGASASTAAPMMSDSPAALADRIMANGQRSSSSDLTYVQVPRHVVGMGARMNAFTPGFGAGFGATMRNWWTNRLGLQFEVLHSRLGTLQGPGHVTSLQFAPSVLYALPDAIGTSLWMRPYVGGGGSLYRTTLNRTGEDVIDLGSENGLGIQAFGGAETTFAAMPQFAISGEFGYRWSQQSTVGFAPSKIGVALAAHWYFK